MEKNIDKQADHSQLEGLRALFGPREGQPDDLRHISRKDPFKRRKIFALIILALVVLSSAALAGFFLFNKNEKFSGDNIVLSISGPANVDAGGEAQFLVTYENNETVDIRNVQLTMQFPTYFRLTSSSIESTNDAKNAWDLGDLKKGSKGALVLTGTVTGLVGQSASLDAILSYTPANFSSEFQKRTSHSVTIKSATTSVSLDIPVRVLSGQEETYAIHYKNTAAEDVSRLRIRVTYPSGFTIVSQKPDPSEGKDVWEIESLAAGKEGEVTFTGTLEGKDNELKEFRVQLETSGPDAAFHIQEEKTALVLVLQPQFLVQLFVNGTEKSGTTSFHTTQTIALRYSNQSDRSYENVVLKANLTGSVIDLSTVQNISKGKRSGTTIIWDKTVVPGLAHVDPGKGGEVSFTVQTSEEPAPGDQNVRYSYEVTAEASANDTKDFQNKTFTLKVDPVVTKISTFFSFRAEARYYNEEYIPVGSGPLPPKVGEATRYRVYWFLQNTTNEVSNVQVQTTLPETVTWTGRSTVSAGEALTFDSVTRIVTWRINKLPPHVGTLIPELEASFEVQVTPQEADVGKTLVLTKQAFASGDDTFTNQHLQNAEDSLTTELANDPLAKGKGTVQPADEPQ